jgi:transposase-like protein
MGNAKSVIKRLRFPLDIMLLCVRWSVAYALSLRNLEEMMQERGLFIDHSTIHRWVIKLVPVVQEAFRKRKRKRGIGAVGKSWRLDETYIKIGGEDRYWYRAVDKQGNTVDFLLTAKRDRRAARRWPAIACAFTLAAFLSTANLWLERSPMCCRMTRSIAAGRRRCRMSYSVNAFCVRVKSS